MEVRGSVHSRTRAVLAHAFVNYRHLMSQLKGVETAAEVGFTAPTVINISSMMINYFLP